MIDSVKCIVLVKYHVLLLYNIARSLLRYCSNQTWAQPNTTFAFVCQFKLFIFYSVSFILCILYLKIENFFPPFAFVVMCRLILFYFSCLWHALTGLIFQSTGRNVVLYRYNIQTHLEYLVVLLINWVTNVNVEPLIWKMKIIFFFCLIFLLLFQFRLATISNIFCCWIKRCGGNAVD